MTFLAFPVANKARANAASTISGGALSVVLAAGK